MRQSGNEASWQPVKAPFFRSQLNAGAGLSGLEFGFPIRSQSAEAFPNFTSSYNEIWRRLLKTGQAGYLLSEYVLYRRHQTGTAD